MSDPRLESVKKRRLKFFESAVLNPVIQGADRSATLGYALVEAVRWAWLGTQIGYLDEEETYALISSHEPSLLRVPPGFFAVRTISKESFFPIHDEGPRERILTTFQNLLLLCSENLFEEDTVYSMDSITWTHPSEWEQISKGTAEGFKAQAIASGFANVLEFFEGTRSVLSDVLPVDKPLRDVPSDISRDSTKFTETELFPYLIRTVRDIMSPRFHLHLHSFDVQKRYVSLAGEFVNKANDGSRAWLDARQSAFDEFMFSMRFFGGIGDRARWWPIFTLGYAESYQDVEDTREKSVTSEGQGDLERLLEDLREQESARAGQQEEEPPAEESKG
jgi:hypothetical protein